jgi:spore maturation protein CgeB
LSYRFVNLTTHYPAFLQHFYRQNTDAAALPYREQQAKIRSANLGWSASMCAALERLGRQTSEIYANASLLQAAWAKENGIPANSDSRKLILKQLENLKPEVLFVEDLQEFHGSFLSELKNIPSVRLLLGLHCAPYTSELLEEFRSLDGLVTCSPGMKPDFEAAGLKTFVIYHAFAPELLSTFKPAQEKRFDLFFAGSVYSGPGLHNQRRQLLEELVKNEIDLALFASSSSAHPIKELARWSLSKFNECLALPGRLGQVRGHRFPRIRDPLRSHMRAPLWGDSMLEATSAAKVVLNNHVDAAGEFAANMRLFEATGLGACLLTDRKKNLTDIFRVGSEVIDYSSPAECAEKTIWLLKNPKEREAIAKAGQRRTLSDHTYQRRAAELDAAILSLL